MEAGEYVAIMGESGSGKTTLLNILAALDKPTAGEVLLGRASTLVSIRERDLAAFRRDHLGFVFQDFNLLDTFSLQDNIYLPLVLAGTDLSGDAEDSSRPIAGPAGHHGHPSANTPTRSPAARSSGRPWPGPSSPTPRSILADEPTGALDSRATDELLELFGQINQRRADHPDGHPLGARPPATPGGCCSSGTGEVFHQLYRGGESQEELSSSRISDTLTVLAAGGGEGHA